MYGVCLFFSLFKHSALLLETFQLLIPISVLVTEKHKMCNLRCNDDINASISFSIG